MSKGREIRCYDYVNHSYPQVRDALRKDALAVFQSATKAAASRAQSIASELRVDIGGIRVETDIRISVKKIEEVTAVGLGCGDRKTVASFSQTKSKDRMRLRARLSPWAIWD